MCERGKDITDPEYHVKRNCFLSKKVHNMTLPVYDNIKNDLPSPVWEGHNDAIDCYYTAWKLAFANLCNAKSEAKFVSDFIDTAFNGYLFMWDSSFIVMFGSYARHIFDFQQTLDNFYSHQHPDGYICREICEDRFYEQWSPDNISSTGPNIIPWAEWEYYLLTGDKDRISSVFDPLMAYHKWLRKNRTFEDGSYFASGYATGMDNSPRINYDLYDLSDDHGDVVRIDFCCQQYLSATLLIKMAEILDRADEVNDMRTEAEFLYKLVNDAMWDAETKFYYDMNRDGTLTKVKTAASYWALLAGMVPSDRLDAFISHLDNENEFKRPCRVPSLSADHPDYNGDTGGYWCGGVWAPTNYMILKALEKYGYNKLAYDIAYSYLSSVVSVYNDSGTLYENYCPEIASKGVAKEDFVGWTGLVPISIMFEYVFGIRGDSLNNEITWYVNRCEKHGVKGYRLGDITLDLVCEIRETTDEMPTINVSSTTSVKINVIWNNGKYSFYS